MDKRLTALEIITKCKKDGYTTAETTSELAAHIEAESIDVPITVHLLAMVSALLEGLAASIRNTWAISELLGLQLSATPEQIADSTIEGVLLSAQAQVYDTAFELSEGVTDVTAEVEPAAEGQGRGEGEADGQ